MDGAPLCRSCGRRIERRSARVYCSRRCRGHRIGPLDRKLEALTLEMLSLRRPGSSLCPSEVARAATSGAWRNLMEPVRRAGRRLAARGAVEIVQGGRPVDAASARGPIRIRATRPPT